MTQSTQWTTWQGKPVDWTAAPHYTNGVLNLILPDENCRTLDPNIISARLHEYVKICHVRMKRARIARSKTANSVTPL